MILTITSDKGTAHGWPASMEAAILQQQNDAQIVHITHHIPAGNIERAAYAVTELIGCYPAKTVHLVAVGLIPGICPPIVATEFAGQTIICPDNGLIPLVSASATVRLMLEFPPAITMQQMLEGLAAVAVGKGMQATEAYEPMMLPVRDSILQGPLGAECKIAYIDRFGNVVLSVNKDAFEEAIAGRPFSIGLRRKEVVNSISRRYNDVAEGQALCKFTDSGLLKIAVNRGSASELLGLSHLSEEDLHYKTVRIRF